MEERRTRTRLRDDELMHYGTKGMKRGQHDPNKRWQSHAVYAQGKPNPNAKVRGEKKKEPAAERPKGMGSYYSTFGAGYGGNRLTTRNSSPYNAAMNKRKEREKESRALSKEKRNAAKALDRSQERKTQRDLQRNLIGAATSGNRSGITKAANALNAHNEKHGNAQLKANNLRKEARTIKREGARRMMATGKRAKSLAKAGAIDVKTAKTREKINAINDRYKNNQLSKGAYERKVDKYTRDLGKYAMRRERGTFAERHARLVGTATGLAIGALLGNPVSAAAGATAGFIGGGDVKTDARRREGSRLLR